MKNAIAKTEFYLIQVDQVINRAYLSFFGFCSKPTEIPNFLSDIEKACRRLNTGFTLLTDALQLKIPPPEVAALHEKSQELWIKGGLSWTAEVLPESAVVQLALNRYSKTTGMKKRVFKTLSEAEDWLDDQR
jgi:hypothetical protein